MKTYTLYHNYDFFNKRIISGCLRDLQRFMLGNGCKCEIYPDKDSFSTDCSVREIQTAIALVTNPKDFGFVLAE